MLVLGPPADFGHAAFVYLPDATVARWKMKSRVTGRPDCLFSDGCRWAPTCDCRQAYPKTKRQLREGAPRNDTNLEAAGWRVQNRDEADLTAGRGVAVREFQMKSGFGFADYLLYFATVRCGLSSPVSWMFLGFRTCGGSPPDLANGAVSHRKSGSWKTRARWKPSAA